MDVAELYQDYKNMAALCESLQQLVSKQNTEIAELKAQNNKSIGVWVAPSLYQTRIEQLESELSAAKQEIERLKKELNK